MRIAYLSLDPGIPVFGTKGASVHIQEVVRELRRLGHEVTIYAARKGKNVPTDLIDLPVVNLAIKVKDPVLREEAQRKASKKLVQQLIADRPDFIYERYSLFSTALAEAGAVLGCPGVLEVNAPLINEQAAHRVLVDRAGAHSALCQQVAGATAVICVSKPVAEWVDCQTGDSKTHVVPNGVNIDRITPQPVDTGRAVVLFTGTLKPWHGVADLLVAAHLAQQEWQLRVVGDGPMRAGLERQAQALGLAVDFRGAVASAEIPQQMAGCRIAVAPYPIPADGGHYFSPLKVYEYLAAGLPVVASNLGELPEVLSRTGIIVPPSDPLALSRAIDTLVADPARCAALARSARRQAEARHSWTAAVAEIMNLAEVNNG